MELITILNRCHRFRGFVYQQAHFSADKKSIEVAVRPRKGSVAICSHCHLPAPGYDQLGERRFEFIPLWGFLVFLLYTMRRVDCRRCGIVTVEEVPWGAGKRTLSKAYMLFLAGWARRLSWKETAEAFAHRGTRFSTRSNIPPTVLAVLEEHRQAQQRDKAAAGEFYDDQAYIFAPPQGGFYRPSNVSTRVSEFFRKHGFKLSMHKLRHAHASISLSEGAPITAVSARLGHAKPSITLELYSWAIPGDDERVALMWDNDRPRATVVEMFPHVPKKAANS